MSLPNDDDDEGWALVGKDGRAHVLPHGMIFIGREECDIILQAVSADKRHAVVYYSVDDHEFLIKDLNSLTGTYVNGVRIAEQTYVKLKDLDCIRFGYDIFYLKRNATSVPEAQSQKPKEETVVEHSANHVASPRHVRAVKNVTDAATEVVTTASSKTEDPEKPPTVSRTDLPPDTLPLNLSANGDSSQNACDVEGNFSDSPDYSHQSESSSCSAPAHSGTAVGLDHDASSTHSSPAAMAFTVAFENNVTTPRKRLGMRDGVRKFSSSRLESDSQHVTHSTVRHDYSSQKFSSATSSASLHKPRSTRVSDEPSTVPGKVQDAACFLIEKMLNTNVSSDISSKPVPAEEMDESRDVHQSDVNDDRSEAGTYTVETENNDGDVEDARKRIDEVFGVMQPQVTVPISHPATATSTTKQIPSLNGHIKMPLHKTSSFAPKHKDTSETECSSLWSRTNKSLTRGRRIPTPAEKNVFEERLHVEAQRARRCSDPPPTPDKSRRCKVVSSPKSPAKSRPSGSLKSPVSRTNNLSAAPGERSASSGDDPSHHRSPDNRSDGSRSPQSGSQWQKVPWNLSGSDAELDQSKSENNSILSDTSTEPSSHSSHSSKNKPDHGPQMRLNRAFALRRARLEADNTKGKDGKSMVGGGGGQRAMKKSSKLSASTTTLRDDTAGTKQNLRLTPAVAKPFVGKPPVRGMESRSAAYKRKPELKTGHRRIESDPGKGIPVWRADTRPSTAGGALGSFSSAGSKSAQKSPGSFPPEGNGLQSFHRSMSCSIMNDTEAPLPALPCSFARSFEQSVISGSQIVTGPSGDEYHSRKHPTRELTALDSLVISAIHQLSSKLWANSKALLEKEREKCPKGGDCWLMIEEVLPSMPLSETPEDGDLTKDLSNILKNLKRVEQGLEVLSCVLDSDNVQESSSLEKKQPLPQNFFIVDM